MDGRPNAHVGALDERFASDPWRAAGLLALFGFVLRMLHNATMAGSPLYWHPLGGHVVFLKTAAAIHAGDWLPGNRPFVENSPLYPYVLALGYAVFGENYLLTRVLTMLADAGTIALVTVLATRHFGRAAGIAAGFLYAAYAPAIFFSAELIYTSYAVLLSTAAVVVVERGSPRSSLAAGILTGLAVDLMPSLALFVPLLLAVPFVLRHARAARGAACVAAGVVAAILPITAANYLSSGEFVVLTTSTGHSFYIGHNPMARAGYQLPSRIGPVAYGNRGSIFDNMKTVAEAIEHRPFRDTEVSPYYLRKGLAQIAEHPGFEARLALARLAAMLDFFEATTYADFYYQRQLSPILRATLTFDLLLPLALIGLVGVDVRRRFAVLAPILAAFTTVLVFYFLARFRMPMIPSVCVLAGAGVVRIANAVRSRAWRPSLAYAATAVVALAFARITWAPYDSANEWNKVGAVWLALGKPEAAEAAFFHARAENPHDPNAYLNLGRLYERAGDHARAEAMQRTAAAFQSAAPGAAFVHELSTAAGGPAS